MLIPLLSALFSGGSGRSGSTPDKDPINSLIGTGGA